MWEFEIAVWYLYYVKVQVIIVRPIDDITDWYHFKSGDIKYFSHDWRGVSG